ncbi:GNAT family N-acetyltransferase [Methanothermobacter sp. KEPCO 2]|nr:GNAT family N-acetyltransferase [Methanothermobacter sp. DP]
MVCLILRNVREEDFTAIAELAFRCPPMVTERNSIYHIFTRFFSSTSFVAEEDGRITGFLLGFISQDDPHEAYIHLLCVSPHLRGRGVASRLLEVFTETVRQKGVNVIYLITKPVNQRAIRFYLKNGFRAVEEGETVDAGPVKAVADYNGPGEDMVVFRRLI